MCYQWRYCSLAKSHQWQDIYFNSVILHDKYYMWLESTYNQHNIYEKILNKHRADSRFAPSQWETALLCNDVSHWLGTGLESALKHIKQSLSRTRQKWIYKIRTHRSLWWMKTPLLGLFLSLRKFHMKNPIQLTRIFKKLDFDWLAVQQPANQKPCQKILVYWYGFLSPEVLLDFMIYRQPFWMMSPSQLTQYCLVTPCGDIHLGQYWIR